MGNLDDTCLNRSTLQLNNKLLTAFLQQRSMIVDTGTYRAEQRSGGVVLLSVFDMFLFEVCRVHPCLVVLAAQQIPALSKKTKQHSRAPLQKHLFMDG